MLIKGIEISDSMPKPLGRPRKHCWAAAVDVAHFCLVMDSLIQYGLIEGVDADGGKFKLPPMGAKGQNQMLRVLAEGYRQGYTPSCKE